MSEQLKKSLEEEYKYGFTTDIEVDQLKPGLSEDVIRIISTKKGEPAWMLDWRLKAYAKWKEMKEPTWAYLHYPPIDYQGIIYYSAPKKKEGPKSLDEVDPKLLETYEKLGIPLHEQKRLAGVAVDAVFDSVSVVTTHREALKKLGIIFCSISEAMHECPELVKQYLGSVVPVSDNFFSALNCAVFTDGSFVYIPKGVKCPLDLSTYFRINAQGTGQFERTLIIADEGSEVSYMEGCTAPMRDENQLHAAVVELVALDYAAGIPGVDAGRVAVCGLSTGAHLAMNMLALDARVRAGVVGCILSTWHHYRRRIRLPPGCDCGILAQLGNQIEQCDWAALAAPKPVQFQHGRRDAMYCPGADLALLDLEWMTAVMPEEEFSRVFTEVERAYRLAAAAGKVKLHIHGEGHRVNNPAALGFLENYFGGLTPAT